MKNGYNLYACIIVSKDESDPDRSIKIFSEKHDDMYVKYYAISQKQTKKLEEVGIILDRSGCHHFVAQSLSSRALTMVSNGRNKDKDVIKKLKSIFKEMDCNLVISLPDFMHQNHNRVFAGDFTPKEVLGKLDWILDGRGSLSNGRKNGIIDMFMMVSVFGGVDLNFDAGKIVEMKNSRDSISPNRLMKVFGIKKENIVRYLEAFFFYPEHTKYERHFKILSSLRTDDRKRKTNAQYYSNYEKDRHASGVNGW